MPTTEFGQVPKDLQWDVWKNASASVHRRFLKRTTGGVDYATADTDIIIGISYTNGVAQNGRIAFQPLIPGRTYLVDCGAAGIVENAAVTATTAGEAVTLTKAVTKFMAGIAKGAGTANKVMTIVAMPCFTSG